MNYKTTLVTSLLFLAIILASHNNCSSSRKFSGPNQQSSSGAFDPKALSGLSLWLQVESLALNDGDLVGALGDKSGNGNNASQADTAKQPVFVKTAFNGKPAIWFDGVDDYLSVPDSATLWPAEVTVISVVSFDTLAPAQQMILSKISTTAWTSFHQMFDNGAFRFSVQDSVSQKWPLWSTPFAGAAGAPYVFASRFKASAFTAADGDNRVDGVSSSPTYTANTYSAGFQIEYTAEPLEIGRYLDTGGPRLHLLGNVAEILIYDRALTDEELSKVEKYIADRYGIGLP